MPDWRIVVPSARRANVIGSRSLAVLDRAKIDPDRVTIYVPDQSDLDEYRFVLPSKWRRRLEILPHDPTYRGLDDIGIRPHTVGVVRNGVLDRSEVGDLVVSMDDDLGSINRKATEQTVEPIDEELADWVDFAFGQMAHEGATLWGVYPVPNAFFQRARIRSDLVHIPAGFHGFVVTGEPWQRVTLDSKEEFERSIRTYLNAKAIRFDWISMGTHGYAGGGGLQLSRTHESADRGCRWLVETFPGLCTLNTSKKSGWTEVRLKDRRA